METDKINEKLKHFLWKNFGFIDDRNIDRDIYLINNYNHPSLIYICKYLEKRNLLKKIDKQFYEIKFA